MRMMKKHAGLADLAPRRYAAGGLVKSNDELVKPTFNPSATFTGSPRGTGLDAKGGQFTAASATPFAMPKPTTVPPQPAATAVGSAVAPQTVQGARNNSLSAFLGGNIAPTTQTPDPIGGAAVAKPTFAAPAPIAPSAVSAQSAVLPEPQTGGLSYVEEPKAPPVKLLSEQDIDARNGTVKYGLPTGETVGYGGKLNDDANRLSRGQLGRAANAEELTRLRSKLFAGSGLSDLETELDATAEGQEFNLAHDPLNDRQFLTRTFRSAFGRDPTEQDMAQWEQRLAQGQDRRALAQTLRTTGGQPWTDEQLNDLIGQGDAFKPELKGDENETILRQQFTGAMGREPTDYELAKYAAGLRENRWSMNPGANNITDALTRRKAEGWARGGRVRRWYGGPLDSPEGFADGGRVTKRDRFIDDQVNAAPTKEEVRAKSEERAKQIEERVEQTPEEKALLEKYRRKSLAERMKAGLSSLLN